MTTLPFKRPLHEHLGCVGYFGFGTGYELGKMLGGDAPHRQPAPRLALAGYCNGCPLGQRCFARHAARVAALRPAEVQEMNELGEKLGTAQKAEEEFARLHKGQVSPFLDMMAQNVDDGIRRWSKQGPKDRGGETIPWPFPPPQEVKKDA